MFTYIKISVPSYYVELVEILTPDLYNDLGSTWEDFMDGKWVLLSEEQVDFKNENPDASVKEVWNMEMIPAHVRTVDEAKREMLDNIDRYDNSTEVNGFTINDTIITWFSVQERLNYKESINAAKILGKETVNFFVDDVMLSVNCDAAIGMLAQIQNYADECFIVTKQHKIAVETMDNIEDIDSFSYEAGYPEKLNFNLV